MNTQISDYSAAYSGRSTSMPSAMGSGQTQQPQMDSMEGTPGGMIGMRQETAPTQQPMRSMQGVGFPGAGSMPLSDLNQPQPLSTESVQFLNGFLRTQIGNRVRVEFLIGTNTYLEKSGKLLAVGANYIVLQQAFSDDLLVCDFFTIKFITIFR